MNEKEKISYVKALMYIALADDSIEKEEEEYLLEVGRIYGLTDSVISEIKECILNKEQTIEDILSAIERRDLKLCLIYDLLALCYADENYSDIERKRMQNICGILDIEKSKLTEMESIMSEQLELQNRINAVLER